MKTYFHLDNLVNIKFLIQIFPSDENVRKKIRNFFQKIVTM